MVGYYGATLAVTQLFADHNRIEIEALAVGCVMGAFITAGLPLANFVAWRFKRGRDTRSKAVSALLHLSSKMPSTRIEALLKPLIFDYRTGRQWFGLLLFFTMVAKCSALSYFQNRIEWQNVAICGLSAFYMLSLSCRPYKDAINNKIDMAMSFAETATAAVPVIIFYFDT